MKKITFFLSCMLMMFVALKAQADVNVYVQTDDPTFNVYTWSPEDFGSWPGSLITDVATLTEVNGTSYYKIEMTGTGRYIIFNKDGVQTQNIPLVDGQDNYFTYPVNGNYSQYETTNPPIEITSYTIAGAEALMGVNWNPAATENDMTLQGDGSYKLVKENVSLIAGTWYEYKVVGNHTWGLWEIPSSGNYHIEVAETGVYNVTFTLTLGDEPALTAEATLVEETPIEITSYTIVGTEALMGVDWNTEATENDMTLQEDGTYKLVKSGIELAAGNYDYKVTANHVWGVWELPTGGANQTLTISEAGEYDVTFTLTLGEEPTLTAEATLVEVITPDYLLHYGLNEDGAVWQNATFVAGEGEYAGKLVAANVVFAENTEFGIKYGDTWYAGVPNEGDSYYWIHSGWCTDVPVSTGVEGLKNFRINEAGTYTFILTVGDNMTLTVKGFPADVMPGDVNNDGMVDVTDINIVIAVMLGDTGNLQEDWIARADVNGDTFVDVSDINALINHMLGGE